jgi:hypothetical protein
MNYILLGSNDGIACEVLAVTPDTALVDSTAMAAKSRFSIVKSIYHGGVTMNGPLPEVGFQFNRPVTFPLERDYNQPWYANEQQSLDLEEDEDNGLEQGDAEFYF